MEGALMLVLLSAVMLVGSYVAGSIPLNVSMSEDKLTKVSVLGAGLLVGTALAVIIPEGVRALLAQPGPAGTASPAHAHQDLHSVIGISLVLGFVFMLLVDQVSSRRGEAGAAQRSLTATVGLVVHAAADGVALGAAATTAHSDVELIVFVAIMLHKAPAAFGLVTFLLRCATDRNRIRRHLLVFSVAAPASALLTYFGIAAESKQALSEFNATGIAMLFSAGTFLYVATVHVLADLVTPHAHAHAAHAHALLPTQEPASPAGSPQRKGVAGLAPCELALLVLGALLPLLLTAGHAH